MSQVTETCGCGATITYDPETAGGEKRADIWRLQHSQHGPNLPHQGPGDPAVRTHPGPEGQIH